MIDRTVSRFEGRIGVLQAELAPIRAALPEGGDLSGKRVERAKLAAYEQFQDIARLLIRDALVERRLERES